MAALMLLTAPNQKGKLVYLYLPKNLNLKRLFQIINDIKTKMLNYNRGIAKCSANYVSINK